MALIDLKKDGAIATKLANRELIKNEEGTLEDRFNALVAVLEKQGVI